MRFKRTQRVLCEAITACVFRCYTRVFSGAKSVCFQVLKRVFSGAIPVCFQVLNFDLNP